jgi:hypothetical protein
MKKSYKKIKMFLVLSSSFVLFSTVSSSLISCNTNSDIHHIIFNESNDFKIVGINSDGYKKGDKISFSINVLNVNKEIEKVLKDNVALEIVSTYTFTMPNNDVNIEVILKDKEIAKEFKVTYEGNPVVGNTLSLKATLDNKIVSLNSVQIEGEFVSVDLSNSNILNCVKVGTSTLTIKYNDEEGKEYICVLTIGVYSDTSKTSVNLVSNLINGEIIVLGSDGKSGIGNNINPDELTINTSSISDYILDYLLVSVDGKEFEKVTFDNSTKKYTYNTQADHSYVFGGTFILPNLSKYSDINNYKNGDALSIKAKVVDISYSSMIIFDGVELGYVRNGETKVYQDLSKFVVGSTYIFRGYYTYEENATYFTFGETLDTGNHIDIVYLANNSIDNDYDGEATEITSETLKNFKDEDSIQHVKLNNVYYGLNSSGTYFEFDGFTNIVCDLKSSEFLPENTYINIEGYLCYSNLNTVTLFVSKYDAVKPILKSITLTASLTSIPLNEESILTATLNPSEADNSGLIYNIIGQSDIISIKNNIITPLKIGTTKIVASIGSINSNELTISVVEASGDPYINTTANEFYSNYTPAKSYMDSYYRGQHNFMSGSIAVPDQAPILASSQPKDPNNSNAFYKNTKNGYSEDKKSFYVCDYNGNIVTTIYKGGAYITLEEVAAYVWAFNDVPINYTTSKSTKPTSSVWGKYLRLNHNYYSGDTTNYPYEPEMPNCYGINNGKYKYYELDIGTTGNDCDPSYTSALYNTGSKITRGASRIVYTRYDSNDNDITDTNSRYLFYTFNHYNDFQEYLNYYGGWGSIFGNITGGGSISSKTDYNPTLYIPVSKKDFY